jgi:hypothetical protein
MDFYYMIQIQRAGFQPNPRLYKNLAHCKSTKRLGTKDTATAKYMRQNEIFADALNYFIYGGEQVIQPNSLEELDTRQIEVPYGGAEGEE